MNVAFLVAVENHSDPLFAPIAHAGADARAMAAALEPLGYAAADRVLLLDGDATKTVVESRLRQAARKLTADDTLWLGYTGYWASEEDETLLTCADTLADDREGTSIVLTNLLAMIEKAACRVVLLLDLRQLSDDDRVGEGSAAWDERAVRDALGGDKRRVAFVAAGAAEQSWASGQLQRGIWSYHFTEALAGRVKSALTKKNVLTAEALQSHLAESVQRTLRTTFSDDRTQTAWSCGGATGAQPIADVTAVLAAGPASSSADREQIGRVVLLKRKTTSFKQLSGYRKDFRTPDRVSSSNDAFIAKLAEEEIKNDVDLVFNALRGAFKFKRVDLQVGDPTPGGASIITPHFTYSINVSQSPDDAAEVLWLRQITDVRSPEQVLSDAFDKVFDKWFDTVEFSPPKPFDVSEMIDRIEALEDERIKLEYDASAKWCKLQVRGIAGEISLTRETFKIVQRTAGSPRALLQAFFELQRTFADSTQAKGLPR